jgi:hypothetical protein
LEPSLVLIRQLEWIDGPKRGYSSPKKVERISEWHVAWLAGDKRTEKGIEGFPKHPQETDPNE